MSEIEFDQLLDAVSAAVAPIPDEDVLDVPTEFTSAAFLFEVPESNSPLVVQELQIGGTRSLTPANDNQLAWPLLPFPDGWYATC